MPAVGDTAAGIVILTTTGAEWQGIVSTRKRTTGDMSVVVVGLLGASGGCLTGRITTSETETAS